MSNPPANRQQTLTGDRAGIDALTAGILDELSRRGYPEASKFAVRLALEEAISNACRHGHKGRPDPVDVRWSVTDDEVEIAVEDRGPGFDPTAIADPTLDENLEVPQGRGIMLMRAYMASVRYNDRGNIVTMTYRRPSARG